MKKTPQSFFSQKYNFCDTVGRTVASTSGMQQIRGKNLDQTLLFNLQIYLCPKVENEKRDQRITLSNSVVWKETNVLGRDLLISKLPFQSEFLLKSTVFIALFPSFLSFIFCLFKQSIQFPLQKNIEKMSVAEIRSHSLSNMIFLT